MWSLKINSSEKREQPRSSYKQTIDSESIAKIQNHIWFSGIAFADEQPQEWKNPEIVVVVYLRFSEAGGKEAAPLAAEMTKKWTERSADGMAALPMFFPKRLL